MRRGLQILAGFARDERGTMIPHIAKAAIAISFLSVIAANVVSNRIDSHEKDRLAQIAAHAGHGTVDTSITGSLARGINAVKLDPCALPPSR